MSIGGRFGIREMALLSGEQKPPIAPAPQLANPLTLTGGATQAPAAPGSAKESGRGIPGTLGMVELALLSASSPAPLSLADFTALAIQHFGRGVRWEQLQVASVPDWQYGEHPIAKARRLGLTVETFKPGPPMAKSANSVPRGTNTPTSRI